jgi:hypothetical protein
MGPDPDPTSTDDDDRRPVASRRLSRLPLARREDRPISRRRLSMFLGHEGEGVYALDSPGAHGEVLGSPLQAAVLRLRPSAPPVAVAVTPATRPREHRPRARSRARSPGGDDPPDESDSPALGRQRGPWRRGPEEGSPVTRLALVAIQEALDAGDLGLVVEIVLSALEEEPASASRCSICGRWVIVIAPADDPKDAA